MKTNYRDNWPVNTRCEHTEKVRQGRNDDIRFEHWIWFSALFALIVIAPAIVEWVS